MFYKRFFSVAYTQFFWNDKRKIKWTFFTKGMLPDEKYMILFHKQINLKEKKHDVNTYINVYSHT